ncbi:hypothetical protein KSF_070340 [Reticulibacter mediterranei]|uniref:ATP-grasp domain-containing protein n=1 Tax=Reticulibacter mediterranei TaxID=2778369 RepID=A0A8J3ILZ9_9CHLR|nr:hypothetical protein KSF_070340 [Reticulibacter mediterranei]
MILFQEALSRLGLPSAQLVSYQQIISGEVTLAEQLTPTTIVRIESPGKSIETEHDLLRLGADEPDPEGERYERLSPSTLIYEKGRLLASRQWYLGLSAILRQIASSVPAERMMNRPDEILLMFDKRRCHALLAQHDIAVPQALPPVYSYDELMAALQERGWSRAFLKLAHGSSASGTIAYRYSGKRHQAFTTVDVVEQAGELRLYNTRRIRKLESQHEIARLVDALCHHRLHVEYWIPKAAFANRIFDMRVVMIGGEPMHTVARMSQSPMTNLHLLNQRGDLAAILDRIGPERWQEALTTCKRAASLFASLYIGVDLLFSSDYRYHAILELNAFGDLLPGLLYQGQDTYSAEILTALEGRKVCSTLTH